MMPACRMFCGGGGGGGGGAILSVSTVIMELFE